MKEREKKSSFIDTHAHLTFPDFKEDFEKVIERAQAAGVEYIMTIGSGGGIDDTRAGASLAGSREPIYAAIGVHPHDAGKLSGDVITTLKELAKGEKIVAIGEIGLDYNRMFFPKEVQRKSFEEMLKLAHELHLPICIHNREADEDCLYALRRMYASSLGGVFHCFSSNVDFAREVLDMGFFISITGVVTFDKKNDQLKDVVRYVPIERMVLETDAPFLAPEPHRGKRNEPSYVPYIAEAIAGLKKLSVEDVARITTLNAKRLFKLPGLVPEGKIAYAIRDSLYLNITNRCNLMCKFCPKRSGDFEVKGHNLKLDREPDVEDIFKAMGDPKGFGEVVFCGFGEPTMRLELLKEVAREIKERGVKVRVNTDGLGNLLHGRNILPELNGLVDEVSVSMNAPNAKTYARLCPSRWGEEAYRALKSFVVEAKKYISAVSVTVVSYKGVDVKKCKEVALKELRVGFRVREYKEVG